MTPNDGLLDGRLVISKCCDCQYAASSRFCHSFSGSVYTNETLTTTTVSSDLDGDSLTLSYTWTVNGSIVQTGTTDTLASTGSSRTILWSFRRAFDGSDTSSAVSASVTVFNTHLPQGLCFHRAHPLSRSMAWSALWIRPLRCGFDTVSYSFAWTIDGTPYSSATSTATSTVAATNDRRKIGNVR